MSLPPQAGRKEASSLLVSKISEDTAPFLKFLHVSLPHLGLQGWGYHREPQGWGYHKELGTGLLPKAMG